jgi:predicted nucleic acid-binding protein
VYSITADPPFIVLDTNIVLDWLLFTDHRVKPLADAVEAGRLRWAACQRMRDEFEHTLGRPALARWQPDGAHLLARFDAYALMMAPPPAARALRCTDANDQVFIDLAVSAKASWLISHDRAVLRLRRPAASIGIRIGEPADWAADDSINRTAGAA